MVFDTFSLMACGGLLLTLLHCKKKQRETGRMEFLDIFGVHVHSKGVVFKLSRWSTFALITVAFHDHTSTVAPWLFWPALVLNGLQFAGLTLGPDP